MFHTGVDALLKLAAPPARPRGTDRDRVPRPTQRPHTARLLTSPLPSEKPATGIRWPARAGCRAVAPGGGRSAPGAGQLRLRGEEVEVHAQPREKTDRTEDRTAERDGADPGAGVGTPAELEDEESAEEHGDEREDAVDHRGGVPRGAVERVDLVAPAPAPRLDLAEELLALAEHFAERRPGDRSEAESGADDRAGACGEAAALRDGQLRRLAVGRRVVAGVLRGLLGVRRLLSGLRLLRLLFGRLRLRAGLLVVGLGRIGSHGAQP